MGTIFNRTHVDYGTYEDALTDWERTPDTDLEKDDKLALAINLRCDYRVSEKREKNFKEIFEKCGKNLTIALRKYQEKYVERPIRSQEPDFCNSENLIADCSLTGHCHPDFNLNDDLVTVMNLNGLRMSLKDADKHLSKRGVLSLWDDLKDLEISEALSDKPYSIDFNQWLDKQFENSDGKPKKGDSSDVVKVIAAFFELLEYDLKQRNEHYKFPVWVTKWNLFQKVALTTKSEGELDVDRWNQVVGVNRKYNTWQIVVKYPSTAVKSLYRPSQLDGGYYPHHFPPPPLLPESKFCFADGGHTMDLDSKNNKLLPEYIHQPIPLKLEYYQGLIGKTERKNYNVRIPRETHYKNLSDIYYPSNPNAIKKWMLKAI